jgi:hypothetical protein
MQANMQQADINSYARALFEAHGPKAAAEAAQKAVECERKGEQDESQTWRHIEEAIKLMRGPHQP